MELTEKDFTIEESLAGLAMMDLSITEMYQPKSKLTKEEATEILKNIRDEILKNQKDAKYLSMMTEDSTVIENKLLERLKNDAEKWNNLENAKTHEALVDYQRLVKLEEQLKGFLESAKNSKETGWYIEAHVIEYIEKIMEGKNEHGTIME